jgi:hypothetical protein
MEAHQQRSGEEVEQMDSTIDPELLALKQCRLESFGRRTKSRSPSSFRTPEITTAKRIPRRTVAGRSTEGAMQMKTIATKMKTAMAHLRMEDI